MDHSPFQGGEDVKRVGKNILVMRYRFIGDTVLTVPFLRNLRRAEPDARISWMVAPGSAGIVQGIPYVDDLIEWDPVTIHADSRGAHRGIPAKLAFIADLRSRRFDKVYVLKRSLSSALIAFLSGARERIGFDTEGRECLLTRKVPYRNERHEVENFLEVLRADGIAVEDDHLELWSTIEEMQLADRVLAAAGMDAGKIAAIHPFSAVEQRGWPLVNFAELAKQLAKDCGYRVIIVGGGADRNRFEYMKNSFGDACLDLVGRSTLRETLALLRRCSLFVGNDSGIMHIAAAAGVPVVALFGPQSPVKFGPWCRNKSILYKGLSCSPCKQKFFSECTPSARMRPECIESISVIEVMQKCRALVLCGPERGNQDSTAGLHQ